jgi:hypothetical protein
MGTLNESEATRTSRGWRWLGGFGLAASIAVVATAVALGEAFTTERGGVVSVFAVLLGVSIAAMVVCPAVGSTRAWRAIRNHDRSASVWASLALNVLALLIAAVIAPFALRLSYAWTVG